MSSNSSADGKLNEMDVKRQAYQAKYYAQKETSPAPKTGSFISKRTTNVYANTLPTNYAKDSNSANTMSYPINTTSYSSNASSNNNIHQNSNYISSVNNGPVVRKSMTPEPIEIPAHLKGRLNFSTSELKEVHWYGCSIE